MLFKSEFDHHHHEAINNLFTRSFITFTIALIDGMS